jgi:hypothetical protein
LFSILIYVDVSTVVLGSHIGTICCERVFIWQHMDRKRASQVTGTPHFGRLLEDLLTMQDDIEALPLFFGADS